MDASFGRGRRMAVGKKKILEGTFFLAVMGLSFYTVFHGQNMKQVVYALCRLSPAALILALFTALFFVGAEGVMIWYLLRSLKQNKGRGGSGLLLCVSYSFIGFFYSGITPSATGGQPMQLYYMCKDENSLSESSVVLMTVALIYKFVLVLIGIAMLVFWHKPLRACLREYFPLFLLGLLLNLVLVLVLLAVMFAPEGMKRMVLRLEKLLAGTGILKPAAQRREKVVQFIGGYQDAVRFLVTHKGKVANVCLFTFLQRCSVFFLTWVVYRGFALEGTDMLTVMLLQASVYIAVDMLPVPGAQGITELMYRHIFDGIFKGGWLMPSLCVTRGISFYFLLVVGMVVVFANHMYRRKEFSGRNKERAKV